jgi:hypothetical protein
MRASSSRRLTRVGQRDLRTRAVAEASAHGRDDESHDGTDAADDNGPEDGGLVAGSPLDVETRGRPELYGSHCECDLGVYTVRRQLLVEVVWQWSWRNSRLGAGSSPHVALRVYGGQLELHTYLPVDCPSLCVCSFSVQSRHGKHEELPVFVATGPCRSGPGIEFDWQPSAGSSRGSLGQVQVLVLLWRSGV